MRPSLGTAAPALPELRPAVTVSAAGSSGTVHWAIIATLGLGLGLLAAAALPRRVVAAAPAPIGERLPIALGVTGISLAVGSFIALLAAA